MKTLSFGVLSLLFYAGVAVADEEISLSVIAENLKQPWGLAQLPDQSWLVTERGGRLLHIDATTNATQPVALKLPDLFVQAQAGLFEVVLAPDFEQSRKVYLSYACGSASRNTTCVSAGTLDPEMTQLNDLELIFSGTYKEGAAHYGGRMTWLPDSTLLLTLGDGFDYREQAQNLDSYLGKIVRMRGDGSVPEDNPFKHKEAPLTYSYGHRNVQGIVYDAERDAIWQHEHGPRGGDELNKIEAGKNYGWPLVTYGIDYTGAYVSPLQKLPGTVQPLLQWTPSLAPAGLALHNGDLWVAHLAGQRLQRFQFVDGKWQQPKDFLLERETRYRAVASGSDGRLYILEDSPNAKLIALTSEK
ncbi:MAG TPA: PQQ-dependent sugar dehydrogenase [Pseudidiomarina sp.]|nr:PQQ-dependent sugar dehydrogenase [Pseudidiomarina sp.]